MYGPRALSALIALGAHSPVVTASSYPPTAYATTLFVSVVDLAPPLPLPSPLLPPSPAPRAVSERPIPDVQRALATAAGSSWRDPSLARAVLVVVFQVQRVEETSQ